MARHYFLIFPFVFMALAGCGKDQPQEGAGQPVSPTIQKQISDVIADPRIDQVVAEAEAKQDKVEVEFASDEDHDGPVEAIDVMPTPPAGSGAGGIVLVDQDHDGQVETVDVLPRDAVDADLRVTERASDPYFPSNQGKPYLGGNAEQTPYKFFGAMIDAGVPDGAGLSAVFRSWHWMRLMVGGNYNTVSPGIHAGATFIPFSWVIGPSLTLEGGHYFEGDANWIMRKVLKESSFDSATLRRVSYDFANAHLGIEFGTKNFGFFIHGGYSYLQTTLKDFQQTVDPKGTSVQVKDPVVRYLGPSGKIGFVAYFF